jgi:hypothetical protein
MANKLLVSNFDKIDPNIVFDVGGPDDLIGGSFNFLELVAGDGPLLMRLDGSLFDPGSGTPASASGANDWGTSAAVGGISLFDSGPIGGAVASLDGVSLAEAGNLDAAADVLTTYRSGSANGLKGYDIKIEFKGTGWTTELQTAFIQAADYFTTVITADLPGSNAFSRGKFIDDLSITAEVSEIDGAGGILGQAGPIGTWTQTGLTATGQMEFDVADASDFFALGLWKDIVTHEMMHVLGFGSLWNVRGHHLVNDNASGQPEFYIGANALAAYQADPVFGDPDALYIPVETDGGAGTAGAHWDDDTLTNELMTGFIGAPGDSTAPNVLSQFSVMSLADLGYVVNYQPYTDLPAPFV